MPLATPLPRAKRCEQVHQPSAKELLDLVRRSQPAVLTGLLDGWPALQRWAHTHYLTQHFGEAVVTASVTDHGHFDSPEPAVAWGLVYPDAADRERCQREREALLERTHHAGTC